MIEKFNTYSVDKIPDGFSYPEEYLKIARDGSELNIYPWWFIDANSDMGDLSYSIRSIDGRNLIPFAKVDDGRNNLACFDGDDCSGNPKVHMLIIDGDIESYSFRDFSDWLNSAISDAKEYNK